MITKIRLLNILVVLLIPIQPLFATPHAGVATIGMINAGSTAPTHSFDVPALQAQSADDPLTATYSYTFFDEIGNIWLKLVDEPEPLQITFRDENSDHFSLAKWSPDGAKFAYHTTPGNQPAPPAELFIYDPLTRSAKTYPIDVNDFEWSPNSRDIIYSRSFRFDYSYDTSVYTFFKADGIWQLDTLSGETKELIPSNGYPLINPQVSSSGRYVAYHEATEFHSGTYINKVFDIENPLQTTELDHRGDCAWSPSQDILACSYAGGVNYPLENNQLPCQTQLVSPGGVVLETLPVLTPDTCDLAVDWSPNGEILLISTRRFTAPNNLGDVVDLYFLNNQTRTTLPDSPTMHSWTPDSAWLEFGGWDSENARFAYNYQNIYTGETIPWVGRTSWQSVSIIDPELTQYVNRKLSLITALKLTEYEIWGVDGITTQKTTVFSEAAAEQLINRIKAKSPLTPEELAAFERFIIQEETLEKIKPYMTIAAQNKAETYVDLFSVLFSLITLFSNTPNPYNTIAASFVTQATDEYFKRTEQVDPQSPDREFYEILFTAFQPQITSGDLLAVLEYGMSAEIRRVVIPYFIHNYAEIVEPALDFGAGSVLDPGVKSWKVTGNPSMASLQSDHLVDTSRLAVETSTSLLQDLEKGSALSDLFKDLADLDAQGAEKAASGFLLISLGLRLIDEGLIAWSDAIAQNAYSCVIRMSTVAGQSIFEPDRPLATCPELQNMSAIPPVLQGVLSNPVWLMLSRTSTELTTNTLLTVQQVAENNPQARQSFLDLQSVASQQMSLIHSAQRLLKDGSLEISYPLLDTLNVELLSMQVNSSLLIAMLEESFLDTPYDQNITSLIPERVQKITASSNSITNFLSAVPKNDSNPVSIAIPVLQDLPKYLQAVEGQETELSLKVMNQGQANSPKLELVLRHADQTLAVQEIMPLPPAGEQLISLKFITPKTGDLPLLVSLIDPDNLYPQIRRISLLAPGVEPQSETNMVQPSRDTGVPLAGIGLLIAGLLVFALGVVGIVKFIQKGKR